MHKLTKFQEEILASLPTRGEMGFSVLKERFAKVDESTLVRNLNKLVSLGRLAKVRNGKNTYYSLAGRDSIRAYFATDFFDRPPVSYRSDFLGSYVPNQSSFLGGRYDSIRESLRESEPLATHDYLANIRAIENLLIDLSYSSSKLEGNTYTYLDTEVLVKFNESAQGKTAFETQMVLNHKNAIRYIIDNRNEISYARREFLNIHSLLSKGLLIEGSIGVFRKNPVKIGGSAYVPLEIPSRLDEEFETFLAKLQAIRNPFEQALFILVFVPYFQAFEDLNKRTSRIAANIPLIRAGLPPLSLLKVKERDYVDAILAVYELRDVSLLADLFVNNWIEHKERYR